MHNKESWESQEQKMEPTEVMEYMNQMGEDISNYSKTVIAMIKFAKDNNIPVDLSKSGVLDKFSPMGEYEIQLIHLRGHLMSLQSDLYDQGVKMKIEDIHGQHKDIDNKDLRQNLDSLEIKN